MKHLFKRGLAIILMLAMVLSLAPLSVFAAEETVNEFVVLSTTDMHGRVWDKNVLNDTNMNNSMLNVATAVKEIRASYDNVILLDNGDTYQGTPVSSYQLSLQKQGLTELPNPMALAMKEIGFDAATIGNHEFNYAWDLMEEVRAYLADGTQGNVVESLCANLYYEATGENVFTPYMFKEFTLGGKTYKIAIIGFENTDCPRWDVPDNYPGIVFTHPDNTTGSIAWEAEKYVAEVKAQGADVVIVAYHSGLGDGAKPEDIQFGVNSENQILSVIKNNTGIDMIIAGHDHNSSYSGKTYADKEGKDVLVVNGAGNNLTKTVFAVNAEGKLYIKSNSVIGLSTKAADADLKAKMAPYVELASEYVNQECGVILDGSWSKSTKFYLEQTDTMDLIGRAQMAMGTKYLAEKYNTEEAIAELYAATGLDHLTVDMSSTSVVVSGSYTVQPGTMSMKKLYQLYKYDNTLYLIPLTGQQIKDALEFNASERLSVNTASGTPVYSTIGDSFTNPIFYGLDFVYDMSEDVGNRVEISGFANGKEFKLDETYIFAVNNYHLGNGPFAAYSTDDAIWSQTDDLGGGVVQDLIAEWLTAETAANGGVKPAPSSWKLTYDAEIVAGKAEGEYIGTYVDPTTLQSEDQVMIYYPAGNSLISNVASGSRLAASADVSTGVSDAGNKQAGTNTAANIFTVVKNEDGSVAFVDAEGKYMTSKATGNGLSMAEGASALANWTFEETDGGYFAHNEGANYNGNYNQYLEFYSGFTTYGMGSPAAYTFQFYKLGVEEDNGGNDDDDNGGSGTDIIDLTDGEYVIATYVDGKYYAMANKFASKINGVEIPVTAEGKVLTEDALGYTLHIIENSNGWNIEGEEGYLSYVSGTNLGTSEEPYYWNIVPSEVAEGLWNITSTVTPERGILYQLGTGNRFGGYAMSNVGKPDYLEVKLLPVDDGDSGEIEPEVQDIVILYTNDIHTYIGNDGLRYSNVAALKAELEAQGKAVLLVDAGDHIQGTAYGAMDKGATIIELMNAAGYDLATLGNHEFDYGMARALEVTNDAAFPYVSANFYHEEAGVRGENVLDSYKIFEVGGLKIAFVGITTPETFTKTTPAYFMDENGNYIYGISAGDDGSDLYADVQAAVDAAWESGADYVIALGHLGDDPASKPWTSEELIANVEGLDAFIDGHSHSTVEGKDVLGKDGYYVRLTQTGQYLDAIGMLTISDYEITTELITEYAGVDEEVKAIEDAWIAEVDTLLGEVIAKSEVDFKISDDTGRLIRKQETNLGDFCADALYYLFDVTEGLGVDVAIMNGGGIRANMDAGDISYKTTKTVHTFGNVACLIEVTGQQILDALEWGAKNVGVGENGGFLHVSGVTYEIHSYIPSTVQADDKGVWCGAPTGEYRVKNVKIGGEDLDVTKTYKLAGYNYTLRDLGDGFAMFDGAVNVKDYVMEDYMVLANYAKSFPEATIKADNSVLGANYGDIYGEGRITIVAEPVEDSTVEILFLGTSDMHGQLYATDYTADVSASGTYRQGWTRVATYIKEQRAAYENVFLADTGDTVQGTPLTYYFAFEEDTMEDPTVKMLRALDYDMWVIGNHEFNYGLTILNEQLAYATSAPTEGEDTVGITVANYLAAETNNDTEKDWATWRGYAPYVIKDYDGVKVAIMGIGNPNIPKWDVPANWEGIYFANPIETYEHYEEEMKAQADLIVIMSHSGIDSDAESDYIRELIETHDSIALAYTGHEHRDGVTNITDKSGKVIPVVSPSTKANKIARTLITFDKATGEYTIVAENVSMRNYAIDEETAAMLKPYEDATWNDYMLQPIGKASGDFSASNLGTAPSAFMDLINQVQMYYAHDYNGENTPDDPTDDTPAQLSISAPLTSGNAANLIPEGDIVLGDMFRLYRYENWFYQITMSGKEVRTWLEFAATKIKTDKDGNPTVSSGDLTYYDVIYGEGFSYTIDYTKPEGQRVVSMTYNGEEVLDTDTFTAVVNNYRYNGGGNYVSYLQANGCEDFIANDEARIIYSTQYDMIQGEDQGQARNMLANYIRMKGTIDPDITSTWKLTDGSDEPEVQDIVILYTNDVHTYINNAADKGLKYSNVAALKAELEAEGKTVILVDAGDHVQGTAYGSMDKGETIIKLMNAAGYDLATLGNHEFDYGMARALELVGKANFPYVSANFYNEKDGVKGETVLDAYKIFEVDGIKIALVGITTPETFTKSTPAYFMDENGNYIYGISAGDDGAALYADVQAAIDAAYAEGATYVIALGHLGDDPASDPWNSEDVIANVSGLHAFIDGHSHSTVEMEYITDKDGYSVLLTQTGEYLKAIGQMTIGKDGISTKLITAYEGVDEEVKAIEDAWAAEVDELLGEVIAKNEVDFRINGDEGRLIRKQETNLGDFTADALYYLFDVTEGLEPDLAIMNGGGIRADMPVGDVSYKTTKTVHTFGNVACLIEVTGQQILDALEWGAKNVGVGENGGFLHVSGVTYEIHSYIPSTVQADDKGVWCGAPTGEYRVKNVMIGGEPLDLTKTYKLAGYNYTLRDLGDGFAMFDGAVNVKDYVMEDYMVLANYAKSFPEGVIKADNSVLGANYGDINGEGRITIVAEEPEVPFVNPYTDVAEDAWYYDYVMEASKLGLVNGVKEDLFKPEANITRAQFAVILYRALGAPSAEGLENPYTDLQAAWYKDAILYLSSIGVVNGVGGDRFAPDSNITREQMVTMLYRAAGITVTEGYEALDKFEDKDAINTWATDAMTWAINVGIVNGISDTKLAPQNLATRAQGTKVILLFTEWVKTLP